MQRSLKNEVLMITGLDDLEKKANAHLFGLYFGCPCGVDLAQCQNSELVVLRRLEVGEYNNLINSMPFSEKARILSRHFKCSNQEGNACWPHFSVLVDSCNSLDTEQERRLSQ